MQQRTTAGHPFLWALLNLRKKTAKPNAAKGVVAGLVGGLIGAWMMSLSARLTDRLGGRNGYSPSELSRLEARRFVNGSSQELDSITVAADWIDGLFGHRLSPGQKGFLAAAVHYGMGAGWGAAYGASVEYVPKLSTGLGSAFGVVESFAVESVGNSALRVTRPLREYSLGEHLQSAADHAVYGVTLELTRRNLRKVL